MWCKRIDIAALAGISAKYREKLLDPIKVGEVKLWSTEGWEVADLGVWRASSVVLFDRLNCVRLRLTGGHPFIDFFADSLGKKLALKLTLLFPAIRLFGALPPANAKGSVLDRLGGG